MKRLISRLMPIVFANLLLTATGTADIADGDSDVAVPVSSVVQGERVSLECAVPNTSAIGSPVPLTATVTNRGEDVVVIGYSNNLRNIALFVEDGNGKSVPLTRWGAISMPKNTKSLPPSFAFGRMKFVPQESFTRTLDLSRCFDLSLPGRYVVTIRWHSDAVDFDAANLRDKITTKLDFEVVEPEQVEAPAAETERDGDAPETATAPEASEGDQ